jgi:hypothetical protein
MALLLHWRRLVPAAGLKWGEIGKALLIAVVAGIVSTKIAALVPLHGSRVSDLKSLALTATVWLATVGAGLWLLRSKLPGELRRRHRSIGPSAAAEDNRSLPTLSS